MTEIRKRGITVTDQTPATETGRQLALEWMLHGTEDDRDAFVADILAIEAEARASLDVERLKIAYGRTSIHVERFWEHVAAEYARLAREEGM